MDLLRFFKRPKKDDIFNKFPDGVLVVSLEGKILDANKKALEMLCCSRIELVGEFFSTYVEGGSNLLNKIISSQKQSVSRAKVRNSEEEVYFEISASRDSEEQKVYVTLRDVSQNYKMQRLQNRF